MYYFDKGELKYNDKYDKRRKELREYAKKYAGFGIQKYDAIILYLDFKLLFNQGEFQSYQEIDDYFKPRNSKDKKNN